MTELRPQVSVTGGPTGPTLGRYHLAEAIGGGPTGEVFRAKVFGVAGFERQFAVKRFYRPLCEDSSRLSLLAEAARRYQTIEHPRIARLHEYGVVDGQAFVAVELVPGIDLGRFIAFTHGLGAPIPPGAALLLIAQLARAVAYAQGRGVPHLGLCPTNVVATPDGDVKVMDFGLLRARLGERPGDDWSLAARLPYLAPEELRAGATSPATDVFQLAAIAYELLSGRRAFDGATPPEIAQKVAAGRTDLELLPAGIGDVLARAFAPRPEDRWSNAGALADYLEAAMRKHPQPGGRSDVAAAVRRAMQKSLEIEAQQISGAMTFPLPSPPASLMGLAPEVPLRSRTESEAKTRVATDPTAALNARAPSSPPLGGPSLGSASLPGSSPTPPLGVGQIGGVVGVQTMPLPAPEPTRPGSVSGVEGRAPSVPDLIELMGDDEPHTRPRLEPLPSLGQTGAAPIMSTSAPPLPPTASTGPASILISEDAMTVARPKVAARSRAAPRALLVIALFAAAGGGGYFAFRHFVAEKTSAKAAPTPPLQPEPSPGGRAVADAGAAQVIAPVAIDAAVPAVAVGAVPDAAPAVVLTGPADGSPIGSAGPPDAGTALVTPPPPAGSIRFESDPPGALVYIDGAAKGKTPLELPATGDAHKVAFVLPGHKLFRGDIDAAGRVVRQTLAKIEPPAEGPGRIKVRCKTKDRLYIIVNGQETGELCPSERIYTPLGEITLELYDPVTDASNTHKVMVKPSSGSQRIRLPD
jgi:serine/threonine-protein kinase